MIVSVYYSKEFKSSKYGCSESEIVQVGNGK
jgi:hypothetical protein